VDCERWKACGAWKGEDSKVKTLCIALGIWIFVVVLAFLVVKGGGRKDKESQSNDRYDFDKEL
jgi:hypothetical protein